MNEVDQLKEEIKYLKEVNLKLIKLAEDCNSVSKLSIEKQHLSVKNVLQYCLIAFTVIICFFYYLYFTC